MGNRVGLRTLQSPPDICIAKSRHQHVRYSIGSWFREMILLALSLAFSTGQPAHIEDIVVVGDRMRRIKLVTKTDRRAVKSCVIKRKSGDPRFDSMLCEATLRCARTVTSQAEMNSCLEKPVREYAALLTAGRAIVDSDPK